MIRLEESKMEYVCALKGKGTSTKARFEGSTQDFSSKIRLDLTFGKKPDQKVKRKDKIQLANKTKIYFPNGTHIWLGYVCPEKKLRKKYPYAYAAEHISKRNTEIVMQCFEL